MNENANTQRIESDELSDRLMKLYDKITILRQSIGYLRYETPSIDLSPHEDLLEEVKAELFELHEGVVSVDPANQILEFRADAGESCDPRVVEILS